ncbi:hypothetical protein CF319_g7065 [Tilletia indica]|nr:hypothetical protein CF319_g7065 [Tilletia indica]
MSSGSTSSVSEGERKVQLAVRLHKQKGLSVSSAATTAGTPRNTTWRRINGTPYRRKTSVNGKRLSFEEERALVMFTEEMHKTGFPLRKGDVEDMAMILIKKRTTSGTEPKPLGAKWFRRFRQRHQALDFKRIATLSRARSSGMTRDRARGFFNLLQDLHDDFGLEPNGIFTMDETGVQRGTPSIAQWFVVPAGAQKDLRPAFIDGSQELTTVIECIGADGSVLPPLYVFKGKTLDLSEIVDEQHGGSVTASETGWTNTLITMRWFEGVFLPNSERISGSGKPRVLTMDGHKSHFPLPVLELAVQKKVHIICLPAHTTQALSPLDVSCFRPLKERWAEELRQEMMLSGCVKRSDVIRLYGSARTKAMTSANAISGFANTGIWPLRGLAAIPASKITKDDKATEAEIEEMVEEADNNDETLDDLWILADSQRTLKAKAMLTQAAKDVSRMRALETLFKHLFERQQQHLTRLKKKPVTFRVHHSI